MFHHKLVSDSFYSNWFKRVIIEAAIFFGQEVVPTSPKYHYIIKKKKKKKSTPKKGSHLISLQLHKFLCICKWDPPFKQNVSLLTSHRPPWFWTDPNSVKNPLTNHNQPISKTTHIKYKCLHTAHNYQPLNPRTAKAENRSSLRKYLHHPFWKLE